MRQAGRACAPPDTIPISDLLKENMQLNQEDAK